MLDAFLFIADAGLGCFLGTKGSNFAVSLQEHTVKWRSEVCQMTIAVPFEITDHPRDFACPECQARYKVVRMRTEPGESYPALQCRVCREPLASTEGDSILKYFLVGRPKRA